MHPFKKNLMSFNSSGNENKSIQTKKISNFECCATLQIKIDHNKKIPTVTDIFKHLLIKHFIF